MCERERERVARKVGIEKIESMETWKRKWENIKKIGTSENIRKIESMENVKDI